MTRIIAGRAGSLRIDVPKSGTRPTSDRVREAVFSTLTSWNLVEDVHVLDLYAGSGALGLEAASRGARSVVLVERHVAAARVAESNARTVRSAFSESDAPTITIERQSVQTFLDMSPLTRRWDVIMLDPPYDLPEEALAANLAAIVPLLTTDAAVLVERSSRSPEPSWPDGLTRVREKRYGETVLWWAEPLASA